MTDSDSDLDIVEEVPRQGHSRTNCRVSSDSDELLDLEDDYNMSARLSSRKQRKSTALSTATKSKAEKKEEPEEVILSDDESEKASDAATEIVDNDDLDSLPSIAPPSPPEQEVVDIDMDRDEDYGAMDVGNLPGSSNSSIGKGSKSSSRSSLYEDPQAKEIDDFFQDIEYSSLAEYLAEMDRKKQIAKAGVDRKSRVSSSTTVAATAPPASMVSKRAAPVPSVNTFARQQSALPKKSKPQSSTNFSEPFDEPPVKTYQMNAKSYAKERKKAKPKEKENSSTVTSKVASKSSAPIPSSSNALPEQGPIRQKQPKNILNMIVLHVAENIISDEIAAKLIEKEVQFKIIDSPEVANSVLFEHNVSYKMVEKDLQVREKVVKEIDDNILVVFPVEKHLELLQGELDRVEFSASSEKLESLTEWIQKLQSIRPNRKITLLIHGLEAYLRKIQRAVQKEYRDRVLQADNPENGKKKRKGKASQGIKLSRHEVRNAFISTQLETHINYRFYENGAELALFLLQFAKSVGEAPYKRDKMKANDFDWYAVADAVGGIPVEESGQGMRSLWLEQLKQFAKVGQESALAVARVYGSPKELYEAYRRCESVKEGKDLLTNIQVTMGVGPLAKTRKLGPEASKKIYRFFTSTDGERDIDG